VAGQLIGYTGGLLAAEVFDPSQESNVSIFSRLLFLLVLAIFVAIGGHRMVMAGCWTPSRPCRREARPRRIRFPRR